MIDDSKKSSMKKSIKLWQMHFVWIFFTVEAPFVKSVEEKGAKNCRVASAGGINMREELSRSTIVGGVRVDTAIQQAHTWAQQKTV